MAEEDLCYAQHEQHIAAEEKPEPTQYKVYKYRWVILGLYFLVSLSSAFQWPMYIIIDNVVEEYYGTTLTNVNLTATVFLLCYVVCIYPATYLLEKMGLRFVVTLAAFGPCIAALVKLLSIEPNRFWVVLVSQTIVAVTQTYITLLPASVAAAWFGPDQVSTACSIASAGIQVAIAVGCIVPTILFEGSSLRKDRIEEKFHMMNIGLAIFCTVVLVIVLLLFRSDPPTPPSDSRFKVKQEKLSLVLSIKRIVKDVPFALFWIGYSSIIGIFYTLCFILNPTVLFYYPNNVEDIGKIGLLCIAAGVVGAAVVGAVLDKFRRYKETCTLVNVLSSASLLGFTLTLKQGISYIYVFQILIGIFMTSAVPVGLEIGAEVTYPLPESVSSGVLMLGSKIFGFVFTAVFSYLFSNNFGIWTHVAMTCVVLFSTILMVFIPFDLKRQAVEANLELKPTI